MSARTKDPIIRAARERMARARAHLKDAEKVLEAALRDLRRHPECKLALRAQVANKPARERVTLAWWYYAGVRSILDDVPLGDAARCLASDLRNPRQTMEEFVRDEEETLARARSRAA